MTTSQNEQFLSKGKLRVGTTFPAEKEFIKEKLIYKAVLSLNGP